MKTDLDELVRQLELAIGRCICKENEEGFDPEFDCVSCKKARAALAAVASDAAYTARACSSFPALVQALEEVLMDGTATSRVEWTKRAEAALAEALKD